MLFNAAKQPKNKWRLMSFVVAFFISLSADSAVNQIEQFYLGNNLSLTDGAPLLAAGPISEINLNGNYIVVHGQKFILDGASQILTIVTGSQQTIPSLLENLSINDYVSITGEIIEPGKSLATDITKLSELYIDGTSVAFVSGLASDIDKQMGLARLGTTIVDYTGALYSSSLDQLDESSIVEFKGTSYGNLFFATGGKIYPSQALLIDGDSSLSRAGRGSGIRRAGRGSGIRAEDDSSLSRAGRGSGIRRAGRGSGIRAEDDSSLSRAGRGSGIR